ncbi:MAG: MBL fold metallo-hydrolase [Desulfurococcales archaeon]|nr:MBL fold metallo-hydrolase [Desulfurococcales archaeon]
MGVWVRVTVLGSGGSVPTRERMAPAIAVTDWMGYNILLDAGEGVQVSMQTVGMSPSSLDLVAVTHSHGDHVNGLPGLLQSMYVNDRERPLTLVAPRQVLDFVFEVLEATETRIGFRIDAVEASGWGSYTVWSRGGDELRLRWLPSCHTKESVAFLLEWRLRPRLDTGRLEDLGLQPGAWVKDLIERGEAVTEGRRIRLEDVSSRIEPIRVLYTGDTGPCTSILRAAMGVDLLIHDSTYTSARRREALERGHSTSLDAAIIARRAGVRMLLLAHVSARYSGWGALEMLREARRIHEATILAWDGATVEVSRP